MNVYRNISSLQYLQYPSWRSTGRARHPTIDPQHLSETLASLWDSASFFGEELENGLRNFAPLPLDNKLKASQLATLRAAIPRIGNDDVAMSAILVQWFDIFNSVYFGGGLTRTGLRSRIHLKRGLEDGRMLYGRYWIRGDYLEINTKYRTSVIRDLERKGISVEEVRIATLLHEMLHAFIYYYFCLCSSCLVEHRYEASQGGPGKTLHGPVWANSMSSLAKAFQETVDWSVSEDIGLSVQSEMKQVDWDPTEEEKERWGMVNGVAAEFVRMKTEVELQRDLAMTDDRQLRAARQRSMMAQQARVAVRRTKELQVIGSDENLGMSDQSQPAPPSRRKSLFGGLSGIDDETIAEEIIRRRIDAAVREEGQ